MYADGDRGRPSDVPNAEESKRFRNDIRSVGKRYNREDIEILRMS